MRRITGSILERSRLSASPLVDLAAMLGTTTTADGHEGTGGSGAQSSAVQAVVSFFGPTDFTTRDWPALAASLQRLGVPARVVAFEHEGHRFTDATNQVAMKQMLEFLDERFRP